VRQVAQDCTEEDYRWQGAALGALQEGAEMFLVHLLEMAQSACIHRKKVIVRPEDMLLTYILRADLDPVAKEMKAINNHKAPYAGVTTKSKKNL
jgi:hypothetical protein